MEMRIRKLKGEFKKQMINKFRLDELITSLNLMSDLDREYYTKSILISILHNTNNHQEVIKVLEDILNAYKKLGVVPSEINVPGG